MSWTRCLNKLTAPECTGWLQWPVRCVQEKEQETIRWIESPGVDRKVRGSGDITNLQYKEDDMPGLGLDRVREHLTSVNLTLRSASGRNLLLGCPDIKCKSSGRVLNRGIRSKA